jgi:hypothetical protein
MEKEIEKEQMNIGDGMCRLSELGWRNRYDTFDTYYYEINDYKIYVSRHVNSQSWSVTLVEYDSEINEINEITINSNATFDWVIQLKEVLSNTTNQT